MLILFSQNDQVCTMKRSLTFKLADATQIHVSENVSFSNLTDEYTTDDVLCGCWKWLRSVCSFVMSM